MDLNRFKTHPEFLIIYRGHSSLVTDIRGSIGQGLEGLYFRKTRFLSKMRCNVEGKEPKFISANGTDSYSMIGYYFSALPSGTPESPKSGSGGEIAERAIELQVNRFIGGGLHQDVLVTNHALSPAHIRLSWELAADFADQSEVEGGKRQQQAPVEQDWTHHEGRGTLTFRYRHPDLPHGTQLRFTAPGALEGSEGIVSILLVLEPQRPVRIGIDVVPLFLGEAVEPVYGCDGVRARTTKFDRARERWDAERVRLVTSNRTVQEAWERAADDLGSLPLFDGDGPEMYTPAAGIPIYQALFGRDALIAAWQASLLNPLMLRGVLETTAKWQADADDPQHDAQPGKIIHQHQESPLSLLGKNPFRAYYGDYVAPGMFLVALATDFAITGERDFVRHMQDKALKTLAWIDRYGDRDGDGFYEYETLAGDQGIKNQGWKDSAQAILYPDGRIVENPLAVADVQGLFYAAKHLMGLTFLAIGEDRRGSELLQQAEALKERFNRVFWMPEERFFALALDRDKKPVKTIAADAGHCLAHGIVASDKAAALAERLMAPDMFSGWGIRTLSSAHPAYNPFAYHLGSVWPWPTALIGFGLRRYGFGEAFHRLAKGLFEASELFAWNRLPEALGGQARDAQHPHPGLYPSSNSPQAWSASAVISLVQTMLGLAPLAPLNTLLIAPDLPEWLPDLTLEGIRVGGGRVSLGFLRNSSGRTEHEVLSATGGIAVERRDIGEAGQGEDALAAAVRSLIIARFRKSTA
ncbi:MAG TPA: glycogen debranching N-terminal domain-containing protein [Stellaceae bacterium]|nr:glycogen debranching N-terminal domain-containing protein [Stellaceae bacterium]